MATRTVPCRVCGKAFVPCNKTSSALGAFNYRGVACSPECGAEYLRRVQEARQNKVVSESIEQTVPDAEASTDETEMDAEIPMKRTYRGQRKNTIHIEEEGGL